eukprot:13971292-Alexandrium_andersonii.AAC.2
MLPERGEPSRPVLAGGLECVRASADVGVVNKGSLRSLLALEGLAPRECVQVQARIAKQQPVTHDPATLSKL